ncbi:MAG: hypothetical protein E7211_10305 [Clostridium lundense]|nr:hypothetical protein [Clostridium lundense]
MSLFSYLIKGTGYLVGEVAEITVKGTSKAIGGIADSLGAEDIGDFSREAGKVIGDFSKKASNITGNVVGNAVDTFVNASTEVGGYIGENIASAKGADETGVGLARNMGKIVGGAASGLVIGNLAGAAVTSVTSAVGTASTGTAISTLHGIAKTNATMANIGGGALSVGGAGIAGGQSVLNGIKVATSISGAVQGSYKSNVPVHKHENKVGRQGAWLGDKQVGNFERLYALARSKISRSDGIELLRQGQINQSEVEIGISERDIYKDKMIDVFLQWGKKEIAYEEMRKLTNSIYIKWSKSKVKIEQSKLLCKCLYRSIPLGYELGFFKECSEDILLNVDFWINSGLYTYMLKYLYKSYNRQGYRLKALKVWLIKIIPLLFLLTLSSVIFYSILGVIEGTIWRMIILFILFVLAGVFQCYLKNIKLWKVTVTELIKYEL